MNTNLQTALNSVKTLPINEQRQLVQILLNNLSLKNKSHQFWQTQTLASIAKKQGKKVCKDLAHYQADFLPETETTDDWLTYFAQQHQQDLEH